MSSLLSEVFLESKGSFGNVSSGTIKVPGSIPSGPYKTSTTSVVSCQSLDDDLLNLRLSISPFSKSVETIRKLLKEKPRNQTLIEEKAVTARKQRTHLKIVLEKMRNRTKSGWYTKNGCTEKDIAKVTCIVRKLGGQWLTVKDVKKLRDELVYWLRHRRGSYAKVDCSRL